MDLPAALPDGSRLLHIGLPKTGTTALQAALDAARDDLAERGVHNVAANRNPLKPARFAAGIPVGADAPRLERRWHKLAEDFRTSSARCSILSSEGLSGATGDRISLMRDHLGPDLHVVVTLRPLAALLPSMWQQAVRRGTSQSFGDWLGVVLADGAPGLQSHDPRRIIDAWGSVFGEDRLVFVVGDPADRLSNLRAFEALMGVSDVLELQPLQNASPPAPEVEMLRHFNQYRRAQGGTRPQHGADDDAMWVRVTRQVGRLMGDAPPPGAGSGRFETPRWAVDLANDQSREWIAGLATSTATVIGDANHLLVDTSGRSEDVDAPASVSTSSAGWFADAVARAVLEDRNLTGQREVGVPAEPMRASTSRPTPRATPSELDAVAARDLAGALWRRLRRRRIS